MKTGSARRLGRWLSLGLVSLALGGGAAQAEIRARLEFGLESAHSPGDFAVSAFGADSYSGTSGSARLMYSDTIGEVGFEFHFKLDFLAGEAASVANAISGMSTAAPPYTLFDLSSPVSMSNDRIIGQSIDRLNFTYSTPSTVIRVGRQALTWGAGSVFHPMDMVAPFAPQATDTEFKPGVDMLYLQVLLDDGSDIELIGVPRRKSASGPVSLDASTFATRFRTTLEDLGATFVLAKDHGDVTAGVGLNGALGGATWNAEVIPTISSAGETHTSALANISTAFPLFGRTALGFAEYYHNGFGVGSEGPALDTLPKTLTERMARGQVYTVNRDYIALGLSTEITPLVNFGSSAILNLADQSYLLSGQLDFSLSDNGNLILGAQVPGGRRGTEFGGLPLSGSGGPYAGPEARTYLLIRQYF